MTVMDLLLNLAEEMLDLCSNPVLQRNVPGSRTIASRGRVKPQAHTQFMLRVGLYTLRARMEKVKVSALQARAARHSAIR